MNSTISLNSNNTSINSTAFAVNGHNDIDITDPIEWGNFVDADGYVHYRIYRDGEFDHATSIASFPIGGKYNDHSCTFFGDDRVIDLDTCKLKSCIVWNGYVAILTFRPDL